MNLSVISSIKGRDQLSITMVCLGNICRSPMAAAVLANKKGLIKSPVITVDSAGTSPWHIGQGPHPSSKKIWEKAGYKHEHTAKQFKSNDFFIHDLILVMDSSNYHNVISMAESEEHRAKVFYLRSFDPALKKIDPNSAEYFKLEVPDPYNQSDEAYEATLAMVERAVDGLLKELSHQ
jgi:protein-tyrosine phosphatase